MVRKDRAPKGDHDDSCATAHKRDLCVVDRRQGVAAQPSVGVSNPTEPYGPGKVERAKASAAIQDGTTPGDRYVHRSDA